MARSEARLLVSIWDDPDFLALSPMSQRMYMFLISQPDLAHDGVIALRERRWSKKAAGLSVERVTDTLDELSTARFVVVDADTEELLIRSFIRGDKVYRQPNVLMSAADHLATVSSREIHAVIAAELARIADMNDVPEGSRKAFAQIVAVAEKGSRNPSPKGPGDGKASGNPSVNPSSGESPSADDPVTASDGPQVSAGDKGSRNPSANPSGKGCPRSPGERGMVTAVGSASPYPVPRSPVPVPRELPPVAPPALASLDAASTGQVELFVVENSDLDVPEPENAGQLTRQWIDYCTENELKLTSTAIKRYGRHIKNALAQGFEIRIIKHALAEMFRDKVVSRPALLENYLIRVQQGPELPPQRLTQHQAAAERLAPPGKTATEQLYDTLTRPA